MDPMDDRLEGGGAWDRLWRVSSTYSLVHVTYPRSRSCDPSSAQHHPIRSDPSWMPACTIEFLLPIEKKLPGGDVRSSVFFPTRPVSVVRTDPFRFPFERRMAIRSLCASTSVGNVAKDEASAPPLHVSPCVRLAGADSADEVGLEEVVEVDEAAVRTGETKDLRQKWWKRANSCTIAKEKPCANSPTPKCRISTDPSISRTKHKWGKWTRSSDPSTKRTSPSRWIQESSRRPMRRATSSTSPPKSFSRSKGSCPGRKAQVLVVVEVEEVVVEEAEEVEEEVVEEERPEVDEEGSAEAVGSVEAAEDSVAQAHVDVEDSAEEVEDRSLEQQYL